MQEVQFAAEKKCIAQKVMHESYGVPKNYIFTMFVGQGRMARRVKGIPMAQELSVMLIPIIN